MREEDFKKPHFKSVVFSSYLKLLQGKYPNLDIAALIAEAGLSLKYISDENNWVSLEFEKRFMNLIIERTGLNDLYFEAGRFSMSRDGLGTSLFVLVSNIIPIRTVYSSIPRMAMLFNSVTEVKILQTLPGQIEMQINANFRGLDPSETEVLRERMPAIIENTRGYLSAIPTIKGLPAARVTAIRSDVENEIYRITVSYRESLSVPRMAAPYLITASFGYLLFWLLSSRLTTETAAICTISVLLIGSLAIILRKIRIIRTIASKSEESLYQLDSQYKEIFESQSKLKRKLEESKAIYELVAQLIVAENESQVLQVACNSLVENLNYDRTFILMVDKEEKFLRLASDRGIQESLRASLQSFKLPIEIDDDNPAKFTNVFRFKLPLLVKDISKHLARLDDPQSVFVLKASGTQSFVAAPIFTKKDNYGILVADCINKSMTMSDDDLHVLTACAKQIAIAIEQQRSRTLLEEAYSNQLQLAKSYARFVPFDMIEMLGFKNVFDVKLGNAVRIDVAVMFTDIVGFTTLAETADSQDVLNFLNSYYSRIEPIITAAGGSLNKYQGDAIMAIFPNSESAVGAALKIQRAIFMYNLEHRSGDRKPIRAGVGISTGAVVFGALGSDTRLEMTAIGDVVNIAARLDSLCREKDEDILVFGAPQFDVGSDINYKRKPLGLIRVKGKEILLAVEAIIDLNFMPEINTESLSKTQLSFIAATLARWQSRKEAALSSEDGENEAA